MLGWRALVRKCVTRCPTHAIRGGPRGFRIRSSAKHHSVLRISCCWVLLAPYALPPQAVSEVAAPAVCANSVPLWLRTRRGFERNRDFRQSTALLKAAYDTELWVGTKVEDNDAPTEECIPEQSLRLILPMKAIGLGRCRSYQRSFIDVISDFQISRSGRTYEFTLSPPRLGTSMAGGICRP